VALEPLFTGLIIGENSTFGVGPYKFSIPSDLRSGDRIYFTWTAFVENAGITVDSGSNDMGSVIMKLNSKACIRTVGELRSGVDLYGTDMFSSVTNLFTRHISVQITGGTLAMKYAEVPAGEGNYPHNLLGNRAPNSNFPTIGIGPFYKML
jgi:hypothetical protein